MPEEYSLRLTADEIGALHALFEGLPSPNSHAMISVVDKVSWLNAFLTDPAEFAGEIASMRNA